MSCTVWDGDQVLHEVSAPASGPHAEVDVPPLAESFLGPHHYGRVLYVHGGGIDQPIAVVRSEYSDSLPRGTVYPLANHKGQYDMGISTCVLVTPRSPLLTEHHGEQQIGTDTVTHQIGDTRPYEHCVRVDWPGRSSFSSGFRRHSWGPAPPWVGSLLYHGKDPSGQMYRRNRFYDPQSGRFTQEDPIGIAGGLNVYGYANGDPIMYSDPYGLCPRIIVDGRNVRIEANLAFIGVAARDATSIRSGITQYWSGSMHGYSVSMNLSLADAPEIEVFTANQTGGLGGSRGRGLGGQMLVGTEGGARIVRAVAGHEFGHVMGLEHSLSARDLMYSPHTGSQHRVTREQLEQAIENCREDTSDEQTERPDTESA